MRLRTAVYMEKNAIRRFFSKAHKGYGFVIREGFLHELEAYIGAHERAGIRFDDVCQVIIYDSRLTVTLRNEQGSWYITDMVLADEPIAFYRPGYIWKRIKLGVCEVMARVFNGWKYVRANHELLTV